MFSFIQNIYKTKAFCVIGPCTYQAVEFFFFIDVWLAQNDYSLDFLSYTDRNPCLDEHCPSFGVCETYSAHEARCVCNEDCPSYENPVCTVNGTTYDNRCMYELSYCRGLDNHTIYHPGSCEGKRADVEVEVVC